MRFGKGSGDFQRVEMMMTPMIDVCFQMIIFFIANMRIFSLEGSFNIEMPAVAPRSGDSRGGEEQSPLVRIRLHADKEGNLAGIRLGQRAIGSFKDLRHEMRKICGLDRGLPISANPEVEFDCDRGLRYEYVMDAVTAVSGYLADDGQTVVPMIEKINFTGPVKHN